MAAESEEFERAWAQIVADLTADDGTDLAQLEQTDHPAGDSVGPAVSSAEDAGHLGAPAGHDRADQDSGALEPGAKNPGVLDPGVLDPGAQDAAAPDFPAYDSPAASRSRRPDEKDPAEFLTTWADEGHFTPPPPPELPAGSPATRLGWAGALGGVATMVLLTLTGWDVPRIVFWAAGMATVAGFVTLVWHLPDSRGDGWDDGARL